MKKLLSILMLLVAIVTGAWADQTTVFSYTVETGTAKDAKGIEATGGTVDLSVNTVESKNSQPIAAKIGSSDYIKCTLSGEATLLTGDVISLTIYQNSTSSPGANTYGVTVASSTSVSTFDGTVYVPSASGKTAYTGTMTVGNDLNGSNIFYVRRNASASMYCANITITRENSPVISASNVNITKDATDDGEINFTVDAKGTTGIVTAAEKEEADWLALGDVDNTNGKVPFTATANTTSSARVATVTLTYTYNTNETVTKDVTITQAPEVEGSVIIKAELTSNTAATVTGSIGGAADVKTATTKDDSDGYKFGGKDQYIGLLLASGYSFQTGDVINIHTTTTAQQGTIAIYDEDKATILYNTGVYKTDGTDGALEDIDNKFVLPAAVNGKTKLYICRTEANNWNGYVKYVEVTRPNTTITLNNDGFATYSSAYDFEYAGADAYGMELTATSLSGTKVTSGKIAAGEGILFKGEAGAKVAIVETTGAEALENNSLIGTTDINNEVISPLGYTYKYALSGDTFKTFTGALVANKAFFGTNEPLSSNSLNLVFDGATAVEAIAEANEAAEAPIKIIKNGQLYIGNYNVAGQQVK